MSSSRKPLIRSNSHSDRPTTMRNWPLFVFLMGLVLFFYIFYVYQAQGAALAQTTEEARLLSQQLSLTKSKLVGSLADLETSSSDKKTLATQLDDVTKKNDECMVSLRNTKLRVDTLEKDTKSNTDNYTRMQEELTALKLKAEELQRNNTALTSLVSTQDQLITQLNQTIGIIKFEKEELKNAMTSRTERPVEQKIEEKPEEKVEEKKQDVTTSTTTTEPLKIQEPVEVQENQENQENQPTTTAPSTQSPLGNLEEKEPESQQEEPEQEDKET